MLSNLKTVLILLFALASSAVCAQTDTVGKPQQPKYSVAQLNADFTIFKAALTEAHPSLYRYQTKESMDAIFRTAAAKITKPMDGDEFWRVVEPVVASLHSAHTDLSPSLEQNLWYIRHPANLLPYFFYAQGDDIFLKSKKKGDTIEKVYQVTSIEGMPSKTLLDTLIKYVSGEGTSKQYIYYQLQGGGFSRVYGRVFGHKPSYAFTMIDSTNKEINRTTKAVTVRNLMSSDRFDQILGLKRDELNAAVSVNYPSDIPSTAVLKIKSFTYVNYYPSFHYQFFTLIKKDKIKNLVIDLRGDGGGLSAIGLDIMRYLVTGTPAQTEGMDRPTKKTTFDDYIVKGKGLDDKPLPDKTVMDGDRYYSYALNFDGNVYVLIDKGTFSAAAIFAASLKAEKKIIVIGEETGGGEAGTDGGFFTSIKLPNSGLLLRLPRYHTISMASNRKSTHGLMPDIPITDDIRENVNTDLVMKKLKELILSNNGKK